MRKTILYISDVNSQEPLFHSQVLPHINELKKEYEVLLLGMTREDHYNFDYSYHSVSGDYFYPISYLNFLRQERILRSFASKISVDIIYSRGTRGGLLGSFMKEYIYNNTIKLFYDVRGDVLDENKNRFWKQGALNRAMQFIFKKSDVAFFVSSYLKIKYCKKYSFSVDQSFIFPTFVPNHKFIFDETLRLKRRKELGFSEDDIVVLYSGNLASWQNAEVILDAFARTENNHLKLLFLTKDPKIRTLLSEYEIKESRVRYMGVSYEIIQEYYFVADYGVLIRDDIPTNRAAAPTKFSEYVNSGLVVITTDIQSDYVQFLKENTSMRSILVKNKANLTGVFNQIKSIERNNIQINTLSTIVNKQKIIFEDTLKK